MTVKRKYKQGDNLQKALAKAGVQKPGKVATVLLDAFIKGDKICAGSLYAKNICLKRDPKNNFDTWRSDLKDKGFLNFDKPNGRDSKSFDGYSEGPKLLKYVQREIHEINKQKFRTTELISKAEVEEKFITKAEVREITKQLKEELIAKMIKLTDPPDTPLKRKKYLKLVSE